MELRFFSRLFVLIAVLGGMAASPAKAVLVDGSISLSGGFGPVDASLLPTTLGAATGIAFVGSASVDQATGDFAGLPGAAVTTTDFQFDPALAPNPVNLWTVGSFTFTMDSLSVIYHDAYFLLLSGTGLLTAPGYEPTPGAWRLSSQTVDQNTFTWSSSTASTAVVPVPAAVWLFGSGLIGIAGIARRRKA